MLKMHKARIFSLLVFFNIVSVQSCNAQGAMYNLSVLNTEGHEGTAVDINDKNEVIGYYFNKKSLVAVIWRNSIKNPIISNIGFKCIHYTKIGNNGNVAGFVSDSLAAIAGRMFYISSKKLTYAQDIKGYRVGEITGINSKWLVGYYMNINDEIGFVYSKKLDKITRLYKGCAFTSINNDGVITGVSENKSGNPEAFKMISNTKYFLGTLGGSTSIPSSINEKGAIVGYAEDRTRHNHAFLWHNSKMVDLGTLGGNESNATDINDLGQIVGNSQSSSMRKQDKRERAFLWKRGRMYDLNKLVNDKSYIITEAMAINNQGNIIATGWMHNRRYGLFLRLIH